MAIIRLATSVYTIRQHKYAFTAKERFNEKGNFVFDARLDDHAKQRVIDLFRKDQDYIFPREIRSFRKKIHLSLSDLSALTAIDENLLRSYEAGVLPSKEDNIILKLLIRSPQNLHMIAASKETPNPVKYAVAHYGHSDCFLPNLDGSVYSPFSTNEVSDWFVHKMKIRRVPLKKSNDFKRLNYFLYLAYGFFLGATANRLFVSRLEKINDQLIVLDKQTRKSTLALTSTALRHRIHLSYYKVQADARISALLSFVFSKYNKYSTSYLQWLLIKKGGPLVKTNNGQVIADDLIYQEFHK